MNDPFLDLARYYDPLMVHVDYDRWYAVAGAVAGMLQPPFLHVDLACGTGTLMKKFRKAGWKSFGLDLSYAMVRNGSKDGSAPVRATADLRALPLEGCADYLTCLFDSVNFLLDLDDVQRAFYEAYAALKDDGIFYFDVVTEKMVLDYFADQKWTENNGPFSSTWETHYSRQNHTAETHIQVNQGPTYTIRERVYELGDIQAALREAGFTILTSVDAESWRAPRKKTVRIDIVAAKGRYAQATRQFKAVEEDVRLALA